MAKGKPDAVMPVQVDLAAGVARAPAHRSRRAARQAAREYSRFSLFLKHKFWTTHGASRRRSRQADGDAVRRPGLDAGPGDRDPGRRFAHGSRPCWGCSPARRSGRTSSTATRSQPSIATHDVCHSSLSTDRRPRITTSLELSTVTDCHMDTARNGV